jgi:small subunit ribosomal protein S8e
MGISRDSRHKRSATGAKRSQIRKKRKFELGRQAANTKIGAKRIHTVRVRGGSSKYRALRLESGNFSWASENVARKTRIINVAYNASNNELVRTNTLVKGCIVQVDAAPFRQWYESHYAQPLGRRSRKAAASTEAPASTIPSATPGAHVAHVDELNKKRSKHLLRKVEGRKADAKVDPNVDEQFTTGRLYAALSSRPGQSGRADGYILEGKELEFYLRKIRIKKGA